MSQGTVYFFRQRSKGNRTWQILKISSLWQRLMLHVLNVILSCLLAGNATEVLFHVTVMSLDTIDESSMVSSSLIFTTKDSFITQDRNEHFEGGTHEATFSRGCCVKTGYQIGHQQKVGRSCTIGLSTILTLKKPVLISLVPVWRPNSDLLLMP